MRSWESKMWNPWSPTPLPGRTSEDLNPGALTPSPDEPCPLSLPFWSYPRFVSRHCESALKEETWTFFYASDILHTALYALRPICSLNDPLWLRDQLWSLDLQAEIQRQIWDIPLQEFDLRDAENVVSLMESPGTERLHWLREQDGGFAAPWWMIKQRPVERNRKGEETKWSGQWETEKRPGPLTAHSLRSSYFLSACQRPWGGPCWPMVTLPPSHEATSQLLATVRV